jgi:toxin YoeB
MIQSKFSRTIVKNNSKLAARILRLIAESGRTPFEGTGKPEPLKGDYQGCWSRRIDDEHRLIYRVS